MKVFNTFLKQTILGSVALGLVSCASVPVHFPTVTSDQIDLSRGRELTASAAGFQLFLLIPIAINDRQQRAYEALKAQAGNDILTDIQVEESWSYGFVGTTYWTTLKATAYPRKDK